jgi:hypothetical protein
MDTIIEQVFAMGYGPCPFYRRSGVLINTSEDECGTGDTDSYRLGCIVPHTAGVHGCRHSRYRRCYFCPRNPFYEVSFTPAEKTVRVQALRASHHVVAVGTQLLLSIRSPELLAMVKCDHMRIDGVTQRKRRRCQYDQKGDPLEIPVQLDEQHDSGHNVFEYIIARLDVCRNFASYDGMIYVTLAVTYRNSSTAVDTKGLYVSPGDLKIALPRDIDQAMTKIVMD